MRYREFRHWKISELSFGGWVLGGDMYKIRDDPKALVKKALDLGINYFDTADIYGRGKSEELLGQLLAGHDVYISTKVGYDFYHFDPPRRRYDVEYIQFAYSMSTKRLRRRPDILYLHNPPPEAIREAAPHVRKIADVAGVALGPETDVLEEGAAALEAGYDALMFVFNILEQEPGLHFATSSGKFLAVRVPHATDVLTDRGPELHGDHKSLRKREWIAVAKELVEREIRPLARELGLTLGQYALKFVLSFPVTTVVLTVTSTSELEEYVEASDGKTLPEEHIRRLAQFWSLNKERLLSAGGGI